MCWYRIGVQVGRAALHLGVRWGIAQGQCLDTDRERLSLMDNHSAPPGKSQKYAKPERERRWLLGPSPDLTGSIAEAAISDLYFTGTRLRLRRSEDRTGLAPVIF